MRSRLLLWPTRANVKAGVGVAHKLKLTDMAPTLAAGHAQYMVLDA